MNIALIGYGKMGKLIETLAVERGHVIVNRINSTNPVDAVDLSDADVAIEFTKPHLAVRHIEYCIDQQIPVVVGTTAWNDYLDHVKTYVREKNGSLLYASNFSIGVNIFFDINRRLAKLIKDYPYTVRIDEIHHTEKLDAPSGTAVTLANDILFENDHIASWVHAENAQVSFNNDQIGVSSYRIKDVPGTHLVAYESEIDSIELKHTAHNRTGFALGAILAAEWLVDKKGIYTMQDLIKFES